MPLPNIISFSGRKQSGKTTLCEVCVDKFSYILINFADGLKSLICELFNINLEYLNNNKENIQPYEINDFHINLLSNRLEINKQIISDEMPKTFNSLREILQFIGTDLIRKYNNDWHINNVRKSLAIDLKYCFGDTRFKNEKKFIDSIGGECWFIIRPANFDISNHSSETDLLWDQFGDNVIINQIPKQTLINNWTLYLESMANSSLNHSALGINDTIQLGNFLLKSLKNMSPSDAAHPNNCSTDKIIWLCGKLMIQINKEKYKYNYDQRAFLDANPLTAYVAGLICANGCIKILEDIVTLNLFSTDIEIVGSYRKVLNTNRPLCEKILNSDNKNVWDMDCDDPYVLENIKLWNIYPGKSMRKEIPDIIKDNIQMLKCWIVGLIDGDGYIGISNDKTLALRILSSESIVDYLKNIIPISLKKRVQIYETDRKLYDLYCFNHNVLDFYEWLGKEATGLGLKRKWDNIEKFKLLDRNMPILF